MWVGTFHAICARLLRMYGEQVGLGRDFVIYDDDDQRTLRRARAQGPRHRRALRHAARDAVAPSTAPRTAARARRSSSGDDYFDDVVARVYPVYQERLAQANGVDFDDLLLKALELCEPIPTIGPSARRALRPRARRRVPGHQPRPVPTSSTTCRRARSNLCVVGDDDQSIYRWRGADMRNILDFERDLPGRDSRQARAELPLDADILDAANAVIARNLDAQAEGAVDRATAAASRSLYPRAEDERDEAEFVVRAHPQAGASTRSACRRDFAVFYRTHAQSRVLEEALRAADLPYQIVGGTRFYERAEVKDLLAYLRVLANPADEVSLERIINMPARGIGETTSSGSWHARAPSNVTLFEALRSARRARRRISARRRARSRRVRRR